MISPRTSSLGCSTSACHSMRLESMACGSMWAGPRRSYALQDELMERSGDAIVASAPWIHPDAIVEGACHSSVVEAEVLIDDGSRVEGSLLMRGTHVGPGCVIRSCLLGESVRVGTGSVLRIVVGDGEVIEAGTHMETHDSEGMVALGGTDLL